MPSARRLALLPSETFGSNKGHSALMLQRPRVLSATPLYCRDGLPLDFTLAEEGVKPAVELSSAVHTYDVNLEALRSNGFIEFALQRPRENG